MLNNKTFFILLLTGVLTACGGGAGGGAGGGENNEKASNTLSLQGSVGDGPIVSATVEITTLDGTPVATVSSGVQASYRVDLPSETTPPLLLKATGGTDTVSGQPPTFTLYSVALDTRENTANLNPFTTLIVKTAQAMPGGLTDSNLATARDTILTRLNFGLDKRLFPDPVGTPVTTANVANVVKASEALAEMIRRTRSALADAGTVLSEDELIASLAGDLSDGLLDGKGPAASLRAAATVHVVSAGVILESLENKLKVNGMPATAQLDAAIQLTLPSATQRTGDVPVTAAMLAQANEALLASRAFAPSNDTLKTLSDTLRTIGSGSLPDTINLPTDAGMALDLVISQLAGASESELNAVISAIGDNSDNSAPVISGSPPTTVTAGGTYSFAPVATDPDGDTLTFSISNRPEWASFNSSTGALTGSPTSGDIGVTTGIVISVSDGSAVSTLPAFSINVTAENETPLAISNTSIPGYQWSSLKTGLNVFIDRGYTYTNFPDRFENLPVLRTANNDKGATGNDFLSFDVNRPVAVYVAYDSRIANLPGWLSSWTATGEQIFDTDTTRDLYRKDFPSGTITLGGNAGGSYSMYTVLVDDGTGGNNTLNNAPTIGGTPPGTAVTGSTYTFTPSAADPDGDNLVFSIINKPAWASFDTATGTISGTPALSDIGTTSGIVITVSDGSLSASLPAFDINVYSTATGTANVSWTPPTTNADGTALTDLAGFRIHYGSTEGNYPNTITIANPTITSYTVNNLPSGTHYFVVTAYDDAGNESVYSNVASKTIP